MQKHESDSTEQCDAEAAVLEALRRHLNLELDDTPNIGQQVILDGFHEGKTPVLVEVWAHQGRSKGSQPAKVMNDFCKMLLAEKLMDKRCRKIFAVCDDECLAFLKNSWRGRFADVSGIEVIVLKIDDAIRASVRTAQKRQHR